MLDEFLSNKYLKLTLLGLGVFLLVLTLEFFLFSFISPINEAKPANVKGEVKHIVDRIYIKDSGFDRNSVLVPENTVLTLELSNLDRNTNYQVILLGYSTKPVPLQRYTLLPSSQVSMKFFNYKGEYKYFIISCITCSKTSKVIVSLE